MGSRASYSTRLREAQDLSVGRGYREGVAVVYSPDEMNYRRVLFDSEAQRKATPMAKRTARRLNKSEEIRKLVKGGAKPMEIQAKLAERGIKVSTPMIYTVRSKMKARRSARKISRRRGCQQQWCADGHQNASAIHPRRARRGRSRGRSKDIERDGRVASRRESTLTNSTKKLAYLNCRLVRP